MATTTTATAINPNLALALEALTSSSENTKTLLTCVAKGEIQESKHLAIDTILPLHKQALKAIKSLDTHSPIIKKRKRGRPKNSSSTEHVLDDDVTIDHECQILESVLLPMQRQIATLRAMLNMYHLPNTILTPPSSSSNSPIFKLHPITLDSDLSSSTGFLTKRSKSSQLTYAKPTMETGPYLETPADLVSSLNGGVPRYKNGAVTLVTPISGQVLIHIPLIPRPIPKQVAAQYLSAIVKSFKTKGTSKSILTGIVNRNPQSPVSSKELGISLNLTAQWNVMNAVLRWWARPLVLVSELDKHVYKSTFDALVTASGASVCRDQCQLVVMVGVTCVGFEFGVFSDSVLPPRDLLRFRITEYHAIITHDHGISDSSISDEEDGVAVD